MAVSNYRINSTPEISQAATKIATEATGSAPISKLWMRKFSAYAVEGTQNPDPLIFVENYRLSAEKKRAFQDCRQELFLA